MLPVLIAMAAGMAAGYIFRDSRRIFSFLDPATVWVIRLLLFLLGVGIGGDRALLAQVPVLGLKGLVLAVSAVLGSVLAARLVLGKTGLEMSAGPPVKRVENSSGIGSGIGNWKAMGGSFIAAAAFFLGLLSGVLITGFPQLPWDPAVVVLYLLMFMVGMGTGGDPTVPVVIRKHGIRLVLLPLAVVAGTLAGTLATALLWPALAVRESLAVGAGFGYYSLSSLLLRELSGGEWAAIALLSNIFREIITLLAAPLLVKMAGPSALPAAGGATSMDTTLAATLQYSGRAWTVPALFSGVVLTILTPFAVTFIMTV
ncbi:MAG: hypothetical protein DRP70_09705 [Spirochaetes bacterium]|nr:MAG: hypothetical protein DRP70_09705 [Spirochaetota bacterium]